MTINKVCRIDRLLAMAFVFLKKYFPYGVAGIKVFIKVLRRNKSCL